MVEKHIVTWVLGGWPDPTQANTYHSQSGLLCIYYFFMNLLYLWLVALLKRLVPSEKTFLGYTFALLTYAFPGHPKTNK